MARSLPSIINPAGLNPSGAVRIHKPLPVSIAGLPLGYLPGRYAQDFQGAGRSEFYGSFNKAMKVIVHG